MRVKMPLLDPFGISEGAEEAEEAEGAGGVIYYLLPIPLFLIVDYFLSKHY